jgi:hypothetical protein
MDKKSKILMFVFSLAVLLSTATTYYRYFVLSDVTYYTDENAFQASLLEE